MDSSPWTQQTNLPTAKFSPQQSTIPRLTTATTLTQDAPIHITPSLTFANLSPSIDSLIPLPIPTSPTDSLALNAIHMFFSTNEFLVPIQSIRGFISLAILSIYKPSQLITRIAILYGPPNDPGGGSQELLPLLSLPRFQKLRLIFHDWRWKSPYGPQAYLKPSLSVIMKLLSKPGLELKLKLDEGDEEGPFKDITCYLQSPTKQDEGKLAEAKRIIAAYRGPASYPTSMLVEAGWSLEESERVVVEVARRVAVRDWMEEERTNEDVEMSG